MTTKAKLFLLLIILGGIIFRYFKFSETVLLNTDQALTYIIADRILNEKFIPLNGEVTSLPIDILPPNFFYFLTILYVISHSQLFINFVFFIMGILSILLIFLFTKIIFKTKVALLTSLIFSFSYIFIRYSRYVWEAHTSPFFSLLSFYFLLIAYQKKTHKYVYLSIILYFIGIMYISPFLVFPAFLILVLFTSYRISKVKNLGLVSCLFILMLLIDFLPVIIFQYINKFPALGLLSEIMFGKSSYISFKIFPYLTALKTHTFVLIQTFFFTNNTLSCLIFFLIISIVLFDIIRTRNKIYLLFVYLPFFSGMFLTGFYQKAVYSYRMASLLPFFAIMFSISLQKVVNLFSNWRNIMRICSFILIIMFFYLNANEVGKFIKKNRFSYLHPFRVVDYLNTFIKKDNENFSIFTIYNRENGQTNYYGAEYWYVLERLRNKRYAKLDLTGNFLVRKINPKSDTIFLICRYFSEGLEKKHCLNYFIKKEGLDNPITTNKIDDITTVFVFKKMSYK